MTSNSKQYRIFAYDDYFRNFFGTVKCLFTVKNQFEKLKYFVFSNLAPKKIQKKLQNYILRFFRCEFLQIFQII